MQETESRLAPDATLQPAALQPGNMPHPGTILLLWTFLAIALQSLHALALLGCCALVCALALARSAPRFFTLLRRTRWIMVSLLLIYGYVTPGEAVWAAAGTYSPTHTGLIDGALQLGRLIGALAGLSIVLNLLSRQQLLSGIYALTYPVQVLGISRERIAVRLALTLHYAESAMLDVFAGWRENIARMLEPGTTTQHEVELHTSPLTLRDLLLAVLGAALLAWVLL